MKFYRYQEYVSRNGGMTELVGVSQYNDYPFKMMLDSKAMLDENLYPFSNNWCSKIYRKI